MSNDPIDEALYSNQCRLKAWVIFIFSYVLMVGFFLWGSVGGAAEGMYGVGAIYILMFLALAIMLNIVGWIYLSVSMRKIKSDNLREECYNQIGNNVMISIGILFGLPILCVYLETLSQ